MGKLLTAIFALCLFSACHRDPEYRILGIIPGTPDGRQVYLFGQDKMLDTVVTKQGKFLFTGKVAEPCLCEIWIDLSPEILEDFKKDTRIISLFVDNSDIRYECESIDSLPSYQDKNHHIKGKVTITGSDASKLYQAYLSEVALPEAQADRLLEQYIEEYENPAGEKGIFNTQRGIELIGQEKLIRTKIQEIQHRFIRANPSSPVSLVIYSNLINSAKLTRAEMDELLQSFDPSLWETAKYAKVKNEVEKLSPMTIGEKYTDLELVDQQGKTVRLSDYVKPGQYNMVEFWASWCGGCRNEIPHLKLVYEAYGQDALNLISVSLDDEDAAWKKALSEEKMSWTQLRDRKGWKGEFITKYQVLAIPFSLILDPEGRIVDRAVVGSALDTFLIDHIGDRLTN